MERNEKEEKNTQIKFLEMKMTMPECKIHKNGLRKYEILYVICVSFSLDAFKHILILLYSAI